MEQTLIGNDVLQREPISNSVKLWFQENGSLPFEHGFQAKTFIHKGIKFKPYHFNGYGVSARNIKTKEIAEIDWWDLPKQTIVSLVNECNRYYNYVMTQG